MIYVKSIVAGIAAVAVPATVAKVIVLWPVMQMSGNWHEAISLTALGTVTNGIPALLIFGAGSYWEFRRLSKRQSFPSDSPRPYSWRRCPTDPQR